MAGGDRGLQRVRALRAPGQGLGSLQRGETAPHEQPVPARAVLIEQEHRLTRRTDACPRARCLNLHQRDEAVHLRLLRHELGQDATEPERVLAQRGSHPVAAGCGRVAFVEDEVDDLEHGRQAGDALRPARDLEGDVLLREGALGPYDALGHGGFRDEEGARDLLGAETAEQAERERHPRLGREHRVAGDEHETQEVVTDVVVDCSVEVHRGQIALHFQLAAELFVLALEELVPPEEVDRAMLGGGHEPGARLVRDARLRPPLECRDERLLGEVLGHPDVAYQPREPCDEPRRFDSPDRVDRAVRIGSRHRPRSQHLPPLVQARVARGQSVGLSQQGPSSRTSTVAHSVAGHSLAIATASALLAQSSRKKPPMISFDSANGPSTTVRLPSRAWTRTASDVSDSLARSTPRDCRVSAKRAMRWYARRPSSAGRLRLICGSSTISIMYGTTILPSGPHS